MLEILVISRSESANGCNGRLDAACGGVLVVMVSFLGGFGVPASLLCRGSAAIDDEAVPPDANAGRDRDDDGQQKRGDGGCALNH